MTSPSKPTPHEPVVDDVVPRTSDRLRTKLRTQALDSAIRKRSDGVPTYSVPEAAALLSISQEYLYRLVQADAFPAVRMALRGKGGRYVIPAKAVDQLLDIASETGAPVDSSTVADRWREATAGGRP